MTVVLIGYTWIKRRSIFVNKEPYREFTLFLGIYVFYIVYSLYFAVNTRHAVFLDMVQWIRPFSVIYCTWILNPQFSKRQKKWMLYTMVVTLLSWIAYHPESATDADAEFPVLGQLAICCGMSWYLFTDESKHNRHIAILLVALGLLAPKFKFLGEAVCFVWVLYYLRKKLNFNSPKTFFSVLALMTVIISVTWTRFDGYYVTGMSDDGLARPRMYKTSLLVLRDFFPLGPGMGTFGTNAAGVEYSPLFYKYRLNEVWGLDEKSAAAGFAADAFYPALAQFGIVGVFLFFIFWKRKLIIVNSIEDMKHYRIALMSLFCLVIEQTADTSFLSGKGMGYCMLFALCLNANRNMEPQEITYEETIDEPEDEDIEKMEPTSELENSNNTIV